MSWPFHDDPSVAVFTSKGVVEDGEWIHFVSHDMADGAWQFHNIGGAPENESDARIVTLRTILKIDPGLIELADLPIGWIAWRDTANGMWKRRME